jgi:hypothetical protein
MPIIKKPFLCIKLSIYLVVVIMVIKAPKDGLNLNIKHNYFSSFTIECHF